MEGGRGEWQDMVRLGIKGGRRGGEMDEGVIAGERRGGEGSAKGEGRR